MKYKSEPLEIDETLPLVKRLRSGLTSFPSGAVDAACRIVTDDAYELREPIEAVRERDRLRHRRHESTTSEVND